MIGQKTEHGARLVDPHSFAHGELDNGQAIIGTEFFRSHGMRYYSVGWERYLFRELYRMAPERFVFMEDLLTLHDAQRYWLL